MVITAYATLGPALSFPRLEGGAIGLAIGIVGFSSGVASGRVRDSPIALMAIMAVVLVGGALQRALSPTLPTGDLDPLAASIVLGAVTTLFGGVGYGVGLTARSIVTGRGSREGHTR